jgi:GntR family transcriptional regulator, negative regulator for fad regulon and positive regulator of fabA
MYQRLPPQRPSTYAEQVLVTDILNGTFPPGSNLPAERMLSMQLGVTRPTLREALRRMEGDGWLKVQQGKPTRVNDFWKDGGLNLLSSLVRNSQELPANFIPDLLQVRLAMAPFYTKAAVENSPREVTAILDSSDRLNDSASLYASYDWKLHKALTICSNNPIYTMILNGFTGFYEHMGLIYFQAAEARAASQNFYKILQQAARNQDSKKAEEITRMVMQQSISLWEKASKKNHPNLQGK